ncbi:MAG: hypothetical protein ACETVU_02490 [Desulfatiglandales bacterium]
MSLLLIVKLKRQLPVQNNVDVFIAQDLNIYAKRAITLTLAASLCLAGGLA